MLAVAKFSSSWLLSCTLSQNAALYFSLSFESFYEPLNVKLVIRSLWVHTTAAWLLSKFGPTIYELIILPFASSLSSFLLISTHSSYFICTVFKPAAAQSVVTHFLHLLHQLCLWISPCKKYSLNYQLGVVFCGQNFYIIWGMKWNEEKNFSCFVQRRSMRTQFMAVGRCHSRHHSVLWVVVMLMDNNRLFLGHFFLVPLCAQTCLLHTVVC